MNALRTLAATLGLAAALAGCATPGAGSHPDGLLASRSPHSPKDTMDRLEAQVKQRNLNVFARIDHAAGAQRIGKTLRPTELLIFGNPQGGTPLMECTQTAGIDLPLKGLVWQDAAGQVWLGVNDPAWLARRHGAPDCPAAANLRQALDALVKATLAP
jgi:uncharacterized protein (DUF302 family)